MSESTPYLNERSTILAALNPLIEQAEREGKWLWCSYQDLWFSPKQLRAENANGKFIWGAVNWHLRDPNERIVEATARARNAEAELERIRREVYTPSK